MSAATSNEGVRIDARWLWANRRDFVTVPASGVVPGDLYANGATITKSRRAKRKDVTYGLPEVNGVKVPLEDCWHLECGKSWSLTTDAACPIVVGRVATDRSHLAPTSGGNFTKMQDPYKPGTTPEESPK